MQAGSVLFDTSTTNSIMAINRHNCFQKSHADYVKNIVKNTFWISLAVQNSLYLYFLAKIYDKCGKI
jgi:hypothetical protein